jgi:HEAT repeat protein
MKTEKNSTSRLRRLNWRTKKSSTTDFLPKSPQSFRTLAEARHVKELGLSQFHMAQRHVVGIELPQRQVLGTTPLTAQTHPLTALSAFTLSPKNLHSLLCSGGSHPLSCDSTTLRLYPLNSDGEFRVRCVLEKIEYTDRAEYRNPQRVERSVSAIRELGEIGSVPAAKELVGFVISEAQEDQMDEEERTYELPLGRAAEAALARMGIPAILEMLYVLGRYPDEWNCEIDANAQLAVAALLGVRDPRAVPVLIELFKCEDKTLHKAVQKSLVAFGAQAVVQSLQESKNVNQMSLLIKLCELDWSWNETSQEFHSALTRALKDILPSDVFGMLAFYYDFDDPMLDAVVESYLGECLQKIPMEQLIPFISSSRFCPYVTERLEKADIRELIPLRDDSNSDVQSLIKKRLENTGLGTLMEMSDPAVQVYLEERLLTADISKLLPFLCDARFRVRIAEILRQRGESPTTFLIQAVSEGISEEAPLRELVLMGESALEDLNAALSHPNKWVRYTAAFALSEIVLRPVTETECRDALHEGDAGIKAMAVRFLAALGTAEAYEALVDWMLDEKKYLKHSWVLKDCPLDFERCDAVTFQRLIKNPKILSENASHVRRVAKERDLPKTQSLLNRWDAEEKFKESMGEKIEEIGGAIARKLAEKLELDMSCKVLATPGNKGHYGAITLGGGSSAPVSGGGQKMMFLPFQGIEIEMGTGIEEMKDRIRILNILVPHEVAHVIQQQRKIKAPKIDLSLFQRIDRKKAEYQANEVLLDKLGFDAARKIYVHGDGDVLFDEGFREAIAIRAYASYLKILLRNFKAGAHALLDETIARCIAVASEMVGSEEILPKLQRELNSLINELYDLVTSGQDGLKVAEVDLLIGEYREIFRTTTLDI